MSGEVRLPGELPQGSEVAPVPSRVSVKARDPDPPEHSAVAVVVDQITDAAHEVAHRVQARSRRILANRWQYLRLVILVPILAGVVAGSYFFTSTVTRSAVSAVERFSVNDCGQTVRRIGISVEKTWEAVLSDTSYRRFRVEARVGNDTLPPPTFDLVFTTSPIYQIMPLNVLRGLSFGVLTNRLLLVSLEYNGTAGCWPFDVASIAQYTATLFADAKRPGKVFLVPEGRGLDLHFDEGTRLFKSSEIPGIGVAFFALNVAVILLVSPIVVYLAVRIVHAQWKDATTGWTAFYFPHSFHDGDLENRRAVACGILFIAEHLSGDPVKNTSSFVHALASTLIHVVVIVVPMAPLMVLRFFLANTTCDKVVYAVFVGYMGLAALYATVYYCDIRWRYQRPFSAAFVGAYFVAVCAFVVVALNTTIWFVLGIVIEPVPCVSIVLFIASIILYAYYAVHEFTQVRQKVVAMYKDVQGTVTQKLGLTLTDMYVMVIGGIVLVIFTATFLFVGYLTFLGSANTLVGAVTAVVAPIVSFVVKVTQLNAIKARVQKYDAGAIVKDMKERLRLIKLD